MEYWTTPRASSIAENPAVECGELLYGLSPHERCDVCRTYHTLSCQYVSDMDKDHALYKEVVRLLHPYPDSCRSVYDLLKFAARFGDMSVAGRRGNYDYLSVVTMKSTMLK